MILQFLLRYDDFDQIDDNNYNQGSQDDDLKIKQVKTFHSSRGRRQRQLFRLFVKRSSLSGPRWSADDDYDDDGHNYANHIAKKYGYGYVGYW